jgi:hypothetical protein
MTKKTRITKAQQKAIRGYVRRGYSANRIQKALSKRHIGMRRQVLLKHIRSVKKVTRVVPRKKYVPTPERRVGRVKYIPRKYRVPRPYPKIPTTKQITLVGKHHGKKVEKTKTGSGKELYLFVKREMHKYNEGEFWDTKPKVIS